MAVVQEQMEARGKKASYDSPAKVGTKTERPTVPNGKKLKLDYTNTDGRWDRLIAKTSDCKPRETGQKYEKRVNDNIISRRTISPDLVAAGDITPPRGKKVDRSGVYSNAVCVLEKMMKGQDNPSDTFLKLGARKKTPTKGRFSTIDTKDFETREFKPSKKVFEEKFTEVTPEIERPSKKGLAAELKMQTFSSNIATLPGSDWTSQSRRSESPLAGFGKRIDREKSKKMVTHLKRSEEFDMTSSVSGRMKGGNQSPMKKMMMERSNNEVEFKKSKTRPTKANDMFASSLCWDQHG
eukprot:CAMPEP_0114995654 /NCGR_PEP_ID=MMETSP0216-20121206/13855_1 /TAXON_ID=223996 /ORGANISM="Protocruzia adherens, Strain Boccale" /LENGTH=294 /DNA_ID=CAMNT_0002359731 /DNA_START=656 /DNA_END=1540 /DNA_ORIENTATION=+